MTLTSSRRGRWAVWLAGLVVVIAAGAATAHGLYEVAEGSGNPAGIAWLYPVITDGLALVAYAATTRLTRAARRYAWAVVVVAAGLSGLAQATYLAGGVGVAPAGLRFGVGAWPAVAAAIAAHLLFLIGDAGHDTHIQTPTGLDASGVQPGGCPTVVSNQRPTQPEVVHEAQSDTVLGDRSGGPSKALSPRDRALTVAELHRRRHGALPSVRELETTAQVGRGTAHNALQQLRARASGLHVITEPVEPPTEERPTQ